MASNRHLGRIIALQTLYEQDFRLGSNDITFDLNEVLDRNIGRYRATVDDKGFVQRLVDGVDATRASVNELLRPIAPEWPIEEIARMDRTILQMGVYELLHEKDTPPKVVINEAVELAKAFGSENSSKFVNGVLGTVLKQHIQPDDKGDDIVAEADSSTPSEGEQPKEAPAPAPDPDPEQEIDTKTDNQKEN